ncbi:hypothetical protein KC19_2G073700 [Ceratodon purpureus]|uniref:Uncharacterized protein n=1 Tax=Ceratodon purpureus TaxID=3225 RepID=A0A8T0ITV1_CERPU|nr:hypothetical protein KC19_2G073700 [Ceratodon purpureus]
MGRICFSIPQDYWSPAFQTRTLSTKVSARCMPGSDGLSFTCWLRGF